MAGTALGLALSAPVRAAPPPPPQDATWLPNPGSNQFNTGANWNPATVPDGTAFFGSSSITAIDVTAATVIGGFSFGGSAPAYTITIAPAGSLTFTGVGIASTFSAVQTLLNGNILTFQGNSTAGMAAIVTNAGAVTDFSAGTGPLADGKLSAGSIAGAGKYSLGANTLTVGGNGASTDVSGIVEGVGGSLVKTGAGTLTLSGANTYDGGTTINVGTLVANHRIGGNIDALGSGAIILSGGSLRTDVTGTYAQNVTFADGTTSVFSAAAGQLAQIGGDLTVGAGTTAIFGVAGVAGAVNINIGTVTLDPLSTIVVAGGTLAGTTSFGNALRAASTRVDAGAILDLRAASSPTIRNLSGAGEVKIPGGGVGIPGLSLTVDGGSTTTFAGAISGANGDSSVLVSTTPGSTGTGRVILAGASTYAGGTTICDCTILQLGNGGTSGSIVGDVANAGTLAFNRSDTYSFDGVISNDPLTAGSAGKVVQMGSGIIVLTAVNTYSGGTSLDAGTLSVSQEANLGDVAGTLALNGGVLRVTGSTFTQTARAITFGANGGGFDIADAGNSFTVKESFAGPGGLSKDGAGTLRFIAAQSYFGATTVLGGTLLAGTAGAFSPNSAFTVGTGATLSLGGFAQSIGSLAGAGTVALGAASLAVGSNGGSTVFSGALTGSGGFTKQGSGTLTLTGASSLTGPTSLQAGMLMVNGSLAGSVVTVNGGTLGGSGTVGGIVAVSGTVAPGNSIGTLNVAGNVSFGAGSTYRVEVNPAGASDRIVATGTALITGGAVQVLAEQGDYALSTRYVILTALGGVRGVFSSLSTNLAFLTPVLSYGATDVVLTLARNDVAFAPTVVTAGGSTASNAGATRFVAITRNQAGLGRTAETLGSGNRVYDALIASTIAEARAGFDALSGEAHAQKATVAIETGHLIRETLLNRLRVPFVTGPQGLVDGAFSADAPGRPRPVALPMTVLDSRRILVWGEAIGGQGRSDGDGNAASLTRRSGGLLLGAEIEQPSGATPWRLGVAGGYTRTRFELDSRGSDGTQDSGHVALYGGTQLGRFALRAGAAYSWNESDLTRLVGLRGFADLLRSEGRGAVAQAFGEIGYKLAWNGIAFEPFAQLAGLSVRTDAATERGGPAALALAGRDQALGFATLGLRAEMQLGALPLFGRAMLGWRHAFGETTPTAVLTFASGSASYRVYAAPLARDALVAEAGLAWRVAGNTTLGLSYNAAVSERTRDQALRGRLDIAF
jgi:outer membrane autotransporter protein